MKLFNEKNTPKKTEQTNNVTIEKNIECCYMRKLKDVLVCDVSFYDMLEKILKISYQEKEKHKRKAFSIEDSMLELIAEGISKVSSAILSLSVATTVYGFFVDSAVDWKWKTTVGGITIILLLISAYILGRNKLNQRKESRETWTRHSLNYNRLMLIVIRFIEMKDYSPQTIEKFKKEILKQMDNNLDKFEKNMKE